MLVTLKPEYIALYKVFTSLQNKIHALLITSDFINYISSTIKEEIKSGSLIRKYEKHVDSIKNEIMYGRSMDYLEWSREFEKLIRLKEIQQSFVESGSLDNPGIIETGLSFSSTSQFLYK